MKKTFASSALLLSVILAVTATPQIASAVPRGGATSTTVSSAAVSTAPAPRKGDASTIANVAPEKRDAVGLIVHYAKGVRPVVADIGTGEAAVTGANATAMPLGVGDDLGAGWRTVTFPSSMTPDAARTAADQLASSPLVLEAYPNLMHYPTADVTTQTSTPWGLGRIDQPSLPLDYTYTYDTTGAGVKAYIVDSGIRTTHHEFTGRVATGYHLPTLSSTTDCAGHGTHVAGTVGGTTYGVAKKVTIVPVRIFDCTGGVSTANINRALDWVIADHQAGTPAVVNMSLGGGIDELMDAKVQQVIADGVTVVVAAGNEGQNSCNVSPARVPDAITVNASTSLDDDAGYSNWGPCSDLYAPGSDVLSAGITGDDATATMSGTSMATPHVVGVVARILSAYPALTPAQVWKKLDAESTPFDPGLNAEIEANCAQFGLPAGCVGEDPEKLLFAGLASSTPVTPVPTALVATAGPGSIGLTWNLPTGNEAAITDYVIQYRLATQSTYTTFDDGVSTDRSATIPSLRPATSYAVRVAAVTTATGVGSFSPSAVLSTRAVTLNAPTEVLTNAAPTSVMLSWSAPTIVAPAGIINDYVIRYRVAGTTRWTTFVDGINSETTTTVTSLSRAKSYDFSIQATIPYTTGAASVVRVSTLTGIASAPTALTLNSVNTTSLTLQWETPSASNGGQIIDYVVRYRLKGRTTWTTLADGTSTATTATIAGLSAGQSYDCEVKAVTLVGTTKLNGATVTARFTTQSSGPLG